MRVRIHVLSLTVALASISMTSLAQAEETEETAPVPSTTLVPAPAPPPAPAESAPPKPEREVDHRYEGGLHIGAMMGGEISPVNWFRTKANVAPTFGYDGGLVVNRHFLFGAYVQFTPFAFDRMSGEKVIGDGSGFFVSGGFSVKGRLPINDALILRGGATVGLNGVSYDGKMKDTKGEFELSGRGLNLGLNVDAVWRASPKVGAVAQLAFLTQPIGEANVSGWPTSATAEGDTRDFRFAPKIFLTVGPELFLW